jgi:hypothetical protein
VFEWSETYTTELLNYIETRTKIIKLDQKRFFTDSDRSKIIDRDTKTIDNKVVVKIRVNGFLENEWYQPELKDENGDMIEYEYKLLIEVSNDGKNYHCDHKDPWIKGGLTIVKNGEMTTWNYNNWKSNKVDEE